MTTKRRHVYDHRIKEQIIRSRNPNLFPELGIPSSTARSWIRRGLGDVVVLDDDRGTEAALRAQVATLEARVQRLSGVLRLVLALVRVSGAHLDTRRRRTVRCRTSRAVLG